MKSNKKRECLYKKSMNWKNNYKMKNKPMK